jgi:hypothetical protein
VEPLRVVAVDALAEGMVISREPLIAGAVSASRCGNTGERSNGVEVSVPRHKVAVLPVGFTARPRVPAEVVAGRELGRR